MDLLASSFYFITKTNSCLFDIQFHRLVCKNIYMVNVNVPGKVKHCQD